MGNDSDDSIKNNLMKYLTLEIANTEFENYPGGYKMTNTLFEI